MNNGYVSLHRKIIDWEWYGDPVVRSLFIHLVLTANFTDKKWKGINVKRGQVLTGRFKLAETLGFSEMQVRTALIKLKSTNEITIKTTNKNSLITVNNYNQYQHDNQQPNQPITNNQPTNNQQITTTNKDNKDNKNTGNEKKEIFSSTANRNETDKISTRIKGLNYGADGKIIHDEKWSDYMLWKANVFSEQSYQEEEQRKARYRK